MKRILSLAVFLLLMPAPAVFARVFETEIKPGDPEGKLYKIDITSKAVAGGMVEFRVVITEKESTFAPLGTDLCIVKINNPDGSGEIGSFHTVPQERNGMSVTCVFTVPEKSLQDPDFCFMFTNYDMFYARLKNYYKKQP